MSTDPGRFSELNTLEPFELRPVGRVPRPARHVGEVRLDSRLQDLAVVVERLFTFYEAMRTGKPVANGDELLAQVRAALSRSRRVGNAVQEPLTPDTMHHA